ncbi:dihydroorotase [Dactylosporangium sp. CA-092794]|uniref:dihydroorotase n=1 Tax=Dactylosporangium sp. CA-092794 TaxID=3239929 RepID=UPI003D8FD585
MTEADLDLLIRAVDVVTTGEDAPQRADIGIRDGKFAEIAPGIDPARARRIVAGAGRLAFPGVIDAHQHWGIYNPLPEDAASESRASALGGVTTALNYMRTGQYYLNRGGAYEEFFPEVLDQVRGRSMIDYGFHLAPMTAGHIDEIPLLIDRFGVSSFKIFMFYGSHGLHGRSADQSGFLMIPPDQSYDYAHFEFIMRGVQAAREQRPERAEAISLSLHCETPEIMRAYTKLVEADPGQTGLAAYHASRPPHSEGLAVTIASFLADETNLATINLLHLSSRKALGAAMRMAAAFPHIDFRREVTIGHLLADVESARDNGGKVNPPLRPRADVEGLWEHLLAGDVDWVVSDHACCRSEQKFGGAPDDVFAARSGFGGAEYLLTGLLTEGVKRGLSPGRIARLTAGNPARRFGLSSKGDIAAGLDADLCLVDPASTWTVHAADSPSTQEYTPFEGMEMTARITDTFVRGVPVVTAGVAATGPATGEYLFRPQPQARPA